MRHMSTAPPNPLLVEWDSKSPIDRLRWESVAVCAFSRSADVQNGLWHDVVMTDGPEDPDPRKLTFEVRWPNSAARDAKVATKFGILVDDSGGAFLLIGHVPPPPWFSHNDRQRGLAEVGSTLEVELGGAFYMTQAALRELYGVLRNHLTEESDASS